MSNAKSPDRPSAAAGVVVPAAVALLLLACTSALTAGPRKPRAPKKETTTIEVPKVEVTAAEGSTATAIRGRPQTPPAAAKRPRAAAEVNQALDPEVIALQTSADLVARDLGFTAAGEITFRLVNRGKVGINVPAGAGLRTSTNRAAATGEPISIDIFMGASQLSVQQPALAGSQARELRVPIPSTYSKPGCLETRDLKVVVDAENLIVELHDDNNVTEAAASARPCPDLAIKSIERDYTGYFNETYSPRVRIINKGNAASPPNQVWGTSIPGGVWPVTGWPELIPIHEIPSLEPGETTSFTVGGSVVSANHTSIRIMVDYYSTIDESDETNNLTDKRL